jgi:hypothetical protein
MDDGLKVRFLDGSLYTCMFDMSSTDWSAYAIKPIAQGCFFSNLTALSSSMSTLISYELVLVASPAARTTLTVTFLVMSLLVLVVLPNATRGEGNYKGLRKQTSQNLRGEENLLATVVRFNSMLA